MYISISGPKNSYLDQELTRCFPPHLLFDTQTNSTSINHKKT